MLRVWPGEPYPLGATWTGEGVNFALFSEHAAVQADSTEQQGAGTSLGRVRPPEGGLVTADEGEVRLCRRLAEGGGDAKVVEQQRRM